MEDAMRNRGARWAIGAVLILAAILVAWRRCDGGGAGGTASRAPVEGPDLPVVGKTGPGSGARAVTDDPRVLQRGAIRGTVREEGGGAPIAGATVCASWSSEALGAEQTREPICATTDASGAYALTDLVPATYVIDANAPKHVPSRWRDDRKHDDLHIAAGETRAPIDLVLEGGAIEVKGVVDDINGGPVGGALVTVDGWFWYGHGTGGYVRTKEDGKFTVWAKPGTVSITATAEGYSPGEKSGPAPGAFLEVLLTPEGVLAGTVVEAGTHKPVVGAMVTAGADEGYFEDGPRRAPSARTDDQGRFRITRLAPGRYKPSATGDGYYGEPAESVLLALGQTKDDVAIEVHPAATVRGTIVVEAAGKETPCPRGGVWIRDAARNLSRNAKTDPDGTVTIKAVLPGKYEVSPFCEDHLPKDRYEPLVVAAKDVGGLVWATGAGATITGRVHDASGAPIAGTSVWGQLTGGDPRGRRQNGWDETGKDGAFQMTGLGAGTYQLHINAPVGYHAPKDPPTATVVAEGTTTVDLTLDGGGTIHGAVVDETGAPVSGAHVRASGARWEWSWGTNAETADDGSFTLRGVSPGDVRVTASRGSWNALRAPGSTDDDTQGKKVTVVSGATVEVRLVVESQQGTITGTVTDSKGAPVADAYMASERESDAAGAAAGSALRNSRWGGWDKPPVVTGTDGSFKLTALAPGNYTVRAYRKGGGEAVVEHVAVGGHAALVMKAAGAIAGTVGIRGAGAPDTFFVSATDPATGFARTEGFYQTGGRFALRDVPAGNYLVTATSIDGTVQTKLALGDGEDKEDLVLLLEPTVTVTGRFVELGAATPVAGLATGAHLATNEDWNMDGGDDAGERKNVSDADGRFEIARVPVGRIVVNAYPQDWMSSPYGWVSKVEITKQGPPTIDVGDVEVPRRRIGPRDRPGSLGLSWAELPPATDPSAYKLQVSHLEANGPAAAAGLQVGDVVASVDGVDVRGDRVYLAMTLMEVAQGTTLHLGLARGTAVSLVVAAPE
jgi:protocatechuate 3,4-dioxygenase beta subunit